MFAGMVPSNRLAIPCTSDFVLGPVPGLASHSVRINADQRLQVVAGSGLHQVNLSDRHCVLQPAAYLSVEEGAHRGGSFGQCPTGGKAFRFPLSIVRAVSSRK